MIQLFKTYGIIFLVLISFQSCKPDDLYYNLNADAKGFLLFDLNDTFKLKNSKTNEIITLTVTSKEVSFIDGGPLESSFTSFGFAPGDIYVEQGQYRFTDPTNCYKGEISVIADQEGGYDLNAHIYGCFGDTNPFYVYTDNFFSTIDVEGIQYHNAYLLMSFPNVLYYSKEKGILKVVDSKSQTVLFSYVE